MILNGLDLSELEHEKLTVVSIPEVKGRVCHIDADFLAYMVSYDPMNSIEDMQHNCDAMIEKMRLMSGASKTMLHLTPKGSDKGGRFDIAALKEYQGNRKDKPKPKFLHLLRDFMHKERGAFLCDNREADDSMAACQYMYINKGKPELSIIATKDKDLSMVPGLMLNWDTGEITDTKDDPFGWIVLEKKIGKISKEGKKSPDTNKLRGRGWKYFWAQLLMGDTADNISGLPYCAIEGKIKKVGPVLAYDLLKDIQTNKEAFTFVKGLFREASKAQPFTHWKTKEPLSWQAAMTSEMKLLWMRRDESHDDVLKWLKETT